MMRIRAQQIAALREAALAERRRVLTRRLRGEGVDGAQGLAAAVIQDAMALGMRGTDDDFRVAMILAEAKHGPSFARWGDVLVAVLHNASAPIEDRLSLIEREVMPRVMASEDDDATAIEETG